MRTTVEIDDALWEAARQAHDAPTKRALIEAGLRRLVEDVSRRRLLDLAGTVDEPGEVPRQRAW